MKVAVLGPGGVGGLLAAALEQGGSEVVVVARDSTVAAIDEHGLRVSSVKLGELVTHPRAVTRLHEPVDALIVATKAAGMVAACERVAVQPGLVLPLLNGLDHIAVLRERFAAESVLAGAIRVEADRPEPGVVVHSSPFLLVTMASAEARVAGPMQELAVTLSDAGVPARVLASEAEVMWSKLVRLAALACTTSAYDMLLGEIRSTPQALSDLEGSIREAAAVALLEGAEEVDVAVTMSEVARIPDAFGTSMQRDIAAGREPELDAIPGSVLRAAARHGLECPTIERLVTMIAARIGVEAPIPNAS
ncbi:MAG: ketopantoate reductase family protein [Solirubrobacteraceae bacterium]